MNIEKTKIVQLIKPLPNGIVEVEYANIITIDGVEGKKEIEREVLPPSDVIPSGFDSVRAVCSALWTPEVIAAYKAACEQS